MMSPWYILWAVLLAIAITLAITVLGAWLMPESFGPERRIWARWKKRYFAAKEST